MWQNLVDLGSGLHSGIAVSTWGPDRLDLFRKGRQHTRAQIVGRYPLDRLGDNWLGHHRHTGRGLIGSGPDRRIRTRRQRPAAAQALRPRENLLIFAQRGRQADSLLRRASVMSLGDLIFA
jgi:hypothetical protein